MRILQLCNKSPFPATEGGPIAMNQITQGLLKAGHHVKVLAINTPKYFIDKQTIPENYLTATAYDSVYIDTGIKLHKAFLNLFTNKSYHVERFRSAKLEEKLAQILTSEKFDIVQLESIFVAPYIETIRKFSDAKIVLRAHNIEHLIWWRMANACRNPLKKFYLKHLAGTLEYFEKKALQNSDGIAAITQVDADYISRSGITRPIISIPMGIDSKSFISKNIEREFPGLFHLGSMNWMPNQEAMKWFLENVWTSVIQKYPELQFSIAGRNMPDWLKNLKLKGINIIGEVANAHEFMQAHTIMIVPLLSGSGMRIKIIEGMACGNTIISTTVGTEGIPSTHGKNILIADSPAEFVAQISRCIENHQFCAELGIQAKQFIAEEFNNETITNKLIRFYNLLLQSVN
jgi:glycosyltransferase involved in cell wall biosynthesis